MFWSQSLDTKQSIDLRDVTDVLLSSILLLPPQWGTGIEQIRQNDVIFAPKWPNRGQTHQKQPDRGQTVKGKSAENLLFPQIRFSFSRKIRPSLVFVRATDLSGLRPFRVTDLSSRDDVNDVTKMGSIWWKVQWFLAVWQSVCADQFVTQRKSKIPYKLYPTNNDR